MRRATACVSRQLRQGCRKFASGGGKVPHAVLMAVAAHRLPVQVPPTPGPPTPGPFVADAQMVEAVASAAREAIDQLHEPPRELQQAVEDLRKSDSKPTDEQPESTDEQPVTFAEAIAIDRTSLRQPADAGGTQVAGCGC